MRKTRLTILVVFFIYGFLFSPRSLPAKEVNHPICIERNSEDYPTAAAAKLLCGASDAGFGWTEIFWYPTVSQSKVQGVTMGPVRMVGRMLTGTWELLTFLVPNYSAKKLTPACALAIIDPK